MSERFLSTTPFHVVVIGGGPVGLVAAIGLARTGARTALLARQIPYLDNRTTALLGPSIDLLRSFEVWHRCEISAEALHEIRLIDDTERLIRAPEVHFRSGEIGLKAFGYNIENRTLMVALEERASELKNLIRFDDEADRIEPGNDTVTIHTRQGHHLKACVVVGADGRHSISRDAAGIEVKRRPLGQTALTFNVSHSRPHRNISTEFHTPNGPCVFVPLPGDRSSIVWVTMPCEAERLMALSDNDLAQAAEQQSHSILGCMRIEGRRNVFPLTFEHPKRLATRRIALVGEAAHVLPPIGAQGLNMGLRDAADIADIVADALQNNEDPGSERMLSRFEQKRYADIGSRSFVIDLAHRSLLSDFLPLQALRALGVHLINTSGPLRRWAMREGLSPSWSASSSNSRALQTTAR